MRKLTAAFLSAALVMLSSGLAPYQALAAMGEGEARGDFMNVGRDLGGFKAPGLFGIFQMEDAANQEANRTLTPRASPLTGKEPAPKAAAAFSKEKPKKGGRRA